MTARTSEGPDLGLPSLGALSRYLEITGWRSVERSTTTSTWAPEGAHPELFVVLPADGVFTDSAELIGAALRVLAWHEKRPVGEVAEDVSTGGIDTVAVRLHPAAPDGQAPLGLLRMVVPALRDYVAASATATIGEFPVLVLPTRRPVLAEAYADRVRVSSQPGSVVLQLSLPLDTAGDGEAAPDPGQASLIPRGQPPFGRRVQTRMAQVAERAIRLADDVSTGREKLGTFAQMDSSAPNATELASLGLIGGPDFLPYQIRFSRSPRWGVPAAPAIHTVASGQQRVLREAADFLRTRQPRTDVKVIGLVVKLSRAGNVGPGDIVVYGAGDDTGIPHKFRVNVSEANYNSAVNAHQDGRLVSLTGDLDIRGTSRRLVKISAFVVLASVEDESGNQPFMI
jgi:hypothetical protein